MSNNRFIFYGTAETDFEEQLSRKGKLFYMLRIKIPSENEDYPIERTVCCVLFPENKRIDYKSKVKGKTGTFCGYIHGVPVSNNKLIHTLVLTHMTLDSQETSEPDKVELPDYDLPF